MSDERILEQWFLSKAKQGITLSALRLERLARKKGLTVSRARIRKLRSKFKFYAFGAGYRKPLNYMGSSIWKYGNWQIGKFLKKIF